LGHGHAREIVAAQAGRLTQGLGDVYASDIKVELLEEIAALFPAEGAQVLLAQSGSDAVTAAIKTATLATGRHRVIAFDGSYHGLGYAPLSACGLSRAFVEPFEPQLSPHVRFAPYPGLRGASERASLEMVGSWLSEGEVAAILMEPILGRGGIVVPPRGFVRSVAALAHAHGALLVADEIWTGLGRSGAWLKSAEDDADLDILCLGKGLGGGLPISACVAKREVMAGWARSPGTLHTSTHAGAPLACAAALATLRALRSRDLVARAASVGARALAAYRAALGGKVVAIRGAGLMIGIELDDGATVQAAIGALLERGYVAISGGVDGATITITPSLTIDETALCELGPALSSVLDELGHGRA
jgi:4-aminobutyrate aminotransferase/(S)-3-amino-2-methylpropionate transaminase